MTQQVEARTTSLGGRDHHPHPRLDTKPQMQWKKDCWVQEELT